MLLAADTQFILSDHSGTYVFDADTGNKKAKIEWKFTTCNLQNVPVSYKDKIFFALNHDEHYFILDLINLTVDVGQEFTSAPKSKLERTN